MIKVMLVEDDPMVRDINFKFVNKLEGFEVISFTGCVEEAKKLIDEKIPDLILLDIFLKNGNGLELLKWIRRKESNCDVILITADKSSHAIQEALRYGAVDYLVKPFTFERLKDALRTYHKRYVSMMASEQVYQETIDKCIFKNRELTVKEEKPLVKGLNCHTYDQVIDFIKKNKDIFTADELAEELGMARVTVRRYLNYMVNEKKLSMDFEYGKIGRPTHFYKKL
jgi:two-component system CitB family response regulator